MRIRLFPALLLALALLPGVAAAAIDIQPFETEAQEARYKALIDELRCPKCLNTNLSGSDSPIASDLRRTVGRMIREGHTDDEIRDYLLSRYGDFILYRPRLTAGTVLLWFGPAVLLVVGLVVIGLIVRRQLRAVDAGTLTDDESERLAALQARAGQGDAPDTPRTDTTR
jgi:cytochrome c-type biogenesis protein CcmH